MPQRITPPSLCVHVSLTTERWSQAAANPHKRGHYQLFTDYHKWRHNQLLSFPYHLSFFRKPSHLWGHQQPALPAPPTFTNGGITSLTAVLVAAAVLWLNDIIGGMRAVAYSDVLQGFVLIVSEHFCRSAVAQAVAYSDVLQGCVLI
eukprot:1145626-Pelagomonas_calceolata.AAC.5